MAELREVTTVNGGQKSVINVVLLSELLSSACLKRVHFFYQQSLLRCLF